MEIEKLEITDEANKHISSFIKTFRKLANIICDEDAANILASFKFFITHSKFNIILNSKKFSKDNSLIPINYFQSNSIINKDITQLNYRISILEIENNILRNKLIVKERECNHLNVLIDDNVQFLQKINELNQCLNSKFFLKKTDQYSQTEKVNCINQNIQCNFTDVKKLSQSVNIYKIINFNTSVLLNFIKYSNNIFNVQSINLSDYLSKKIRLLYNVDNWRFQFSFIQENREFFIRKDKGFLINSWINRMSGEDKNVDILVKLLKDTRLPDGVSFAGKGLKLNTAEDAKPVVEAIEACDYLVSLNLEGNTIGVEAAEAIAKALEKKPEFKCALWKDMFTGRLKEEIPKALKALCGGVMKAKAQLEVLDLSDNASGPIGVDGISDFIRSPSCYTLKELRLNNMGLGVTGAQMLSDALLECCWRAEKDGNPLELKVFIAGRNRLENEGTKALSCVFKKIESLEELSIPQNGIYHVGIKALSDALYFNRNLKRLNLNDNSPREMGAKALSRALNNVIALKSLDLGDCLIKNSGALAVAEMLHHAHHIEEVVLSFNSIKVDGAFAVIEALKSKKNFTSLKLDGNKFGENGIAKIKTLVDEIWKSKNVLDSLEEDEGSEDDDEDDNDGEEAEEEEEEEDNEEYDDEESGSLYDNGEEISGEEEEDDDDEDDDVKVVENDNNTSRKVTTEEKKVVTVSEFIANPTIGNLMALGKDPADKLVDEIMEEQSDEPPEIFGTPPNELNDLCIKCGETLNEYRPKNFKKILERTNHQLHNMKSEQAEYAIKLIENILDLGYEGRLTKSFTLINAEQNFNVKKMIDCDNDSFTRIEEAFNDLKI
ncbi:hypothetical protein O3M35_002112 [Rhynocoris fuscipes]|uniref:Ran GTPase-activating protein 1 n=2 Tax=Rhynocoris fuscipes TaxID=488301 RepID=A0AAW1CVS9_9HEMI